MRYYRPLGRYADKPEHIGARAILRRGGPQLARVDWDGQDQVRVIQTDSPGNTRPSQIRVSSPGTSSYLYWRTSAQDGWTERSMQLARNAAAMVVFHNADFV